MSRFLAKGAQFFVDLFLLSVAFWFAFVFRFEFTLELYHLKLAFFTWPYVVVFEYLLLSIFGVPRQDLLEVQPDALPWPAIHADGSPLRNEERAPLVALRTGRPVRKKHGYDMFFKYLESRRITKEAGHSDQQVAKERFRLLGSLPQILYVPVKVFDLVDSQAPFDPAVYRV